MTIKTERRLAFALAALPLADRDQVLSALANSDDPLGWLNRRQRRERDAFCAAVGVRLVERDGAEYIVFAEG